MSYLFYIASTVAVLATLFALTRRNAMHALLYLIVSLLSIAMVFLALGAHLAAALEVIIYAGAIMVFFIFVIMMLNIAEAPIPMEDDWLTLRAWVGPAALAAVLAGELAYVLLTAGQVPGHAAAASKKVGIALYGPYMLGVELASLLLLAGLVGAFHLGRRDDQGPPEGTGG
ncbi:MAG: NADH-quinone oxidoreductase subunit J [Pseudomonadota bacterium]|jgi:NADH-quinone oxidoreductase subunit J